MTLDNSSSPAVRLRLNPTLSSWSALDGGWWPRSRDAGAELPGLVAGLDSRFGVIIRAMLNMDVWDDNPRRLVAGPRRIHMGWYHTMAADRIYVVNTEGERFALLVVAPEATEESAGIAMAMGGGGQGRHPAGGGPHRQRDRRMTNSRGGFRARGRHPGKMVLVGLPRDAPTAGRCMAPARPPLRGGRPSSPDKPQLDR
jgi:uncharacterized protein DUF5994